MESGASVYILSVLALAVAVSESTTSVSETLPNSIVSENKSSGQESTAPTLRGNSSQFMALNSKQNCHQSEQDYCMNGICQYHESQDQVTKHRICICHQGYTGTRCQHVLLTSQGVEKSERFLNIAVGIGIGLLLSGLAVLFYYCCRKRCQKSNTMYSTCSRQARV
ncbi:epigen-like [Pristis pectinata]|uniref:epigen-like n=1 Tax=Pristis pectinata TaxID=685728 RepID=UPI00223E5E23|nr:epigen-like [Pristis pectinata]